MKKTKIVASIVLAAALGTATLAACGGGGSGKKIENNFDFTNYAHPLDSAYAEKTLSFCENNNNSYFGAYTSVNRMNYKSLTKLSASSTWADNYGIATVEDSEGNQTKTLVNVKTNTEVLSGYTGIQENSSNGTITFGLTKKNAETGEHEYYLAGPDGKLLFTAPQKSSSDYTFELVKSVRNENDFFTNFYKVTYVSEYATEGENKEAELFFKQAPTEDGYTWGASTEKEAEDAKDYNAYGAGTVYAERESVLDLMGYSDEMFPKSQLVGYEYSMVQSGSAMGLTLFKDGEKKASLEINGGYPLTVIGNYFYYYEMNPIDSDAKSGYNLETVISSAVLKFDYHLYRYDFINAAEKPEEVKTDFVSVSMDTPNSLYNYNDDNFDRAFLAVYEKIGGVAIVGSNGIRQLVLDENFKPVADLSGKAYTANTYRLNDNSFLVTGRSQNYIIDKDYTVLSEFSGSNIAIWKAENLIRIPTDSGMYSAAMFVDFDGKVAIEGVQTTNTLIYGDSLAVRNSTSSSYMPEYTIFNKANPSGIEAAKLVKATKEDQVVVINGAILKVTPKDAELMTTNITVYDLAGKQIGTIENVLLSSLSALQYSSNSTIAGKLVLSGFQTKASAAEETVTETFIIG